MKFRINKAAYDALTDEQKARYELVEGSTDYKLQGVEGAVPKEALDEFRNTNIELKKQVETLTAQFAGVDVAAYKTMMEEQQKIRDKKLLDAGQVDQLVAERVAKMETTFKQKEETLTKENTALKTNLERHIIDNGIITAAAKVGARKEAVDDIIARGRSLFKVVDNVAVPMDGDKVVYGEDGRTPMTLEGWLKELAPKAPHLFEPSQGGGSGGHKPGAPAGSKRVMSRAEFNKLDPAAQHAALTGADKATVVD